MQIQIKSYIFIIQKSKCWNDAANLGPNKIVILALNITMSDIGKSLIVTGLWKNIGKDYMYCIMKAKITLVYWGTYIPYSVWFR